MAPLRERVEDIPLLMNELISRMEHEKRGSIRFNRLPSCRSAGTTGQVTFANWPTSSNGWRLRILTVIGVMELPKKFRHVDDDDEQYATSLHDEMEERAAISAPMVVL